MRKSTVVELAPAAISQDTVRACRYLLQEAEAGRIVGLAWAAQLPGCDYEVDIAGSAKRNPAFTLGTILKLLQVVAESGAT